MREVECADEEREDAQLATGGCLVLAWGPPWHWLPKLSFGQVAYAGGVSVTWGPLGLYYVPTGVGALLVGSALYRAMRGRS